MNRETGWVGSASHVEDRMAGQRRMRMRVKVKVKMMTMTMTEQ